MSASRDLKQAGVGVSHRLTERQTNCLRELVPSYRDEPAKWLRPMDVGGNGSNGMSAVLGQLVRKGLAEDTGKTPHMERGSKRYRATPAGIEANGPRPTKAEADARFRQLTADRKAKAADTSERSSRSGTTT